MRSSVAAVRTPSPPHVVPENEGHRLSSFEIPQSLRGLEVLTSRCNPARVTSMNGRALFASEVTGIFGKLSHISLRIDRIAT